ncbi:hypothetical protein ACKKBG_A10060 [Auxenochlorella protothecoides x Auxenochlorella symbiontica]
MRPSPNSGTCYPQFPSPQGLTLVMDGWQDAADRPVLDFFAMTSAGGRFTRSTDAADGCNTAEYLADQLEAVIKEIGIKSVDLMITDNAIPCQLAGAIIEQRYPSIR